MKNPWIIPAAALLVGGAGGFIAGKSGSETNASTAEDAATVAGTGRASVSASATGAERAARPKNLEEIYRQPGQVNRMQALLDYYQKLSPEQLEAEAAKLENLPMGERIMASMLLFGKWAETDPTGAMAYSDKMGFAGMFVKPTILQSWASVDPENAAQYYAKHPREFAMMGMGGGGRGPGGQSGASIIASEWAKNDAEAAMVWAKSLERDKGQAMTSVVREVAQSDPKKAAELAAAIEGNDKADAYASIARQWGAKNFSEAEAWIQSLPSDEQGRAMSSALRGLAADNPQLASQKVAAMADGDSKNDAMSEIAQTWSREDPKAAAAWLASQNNEDASRDAIREVVSNWARQDDAGVVSYINQQPAGDSRDNAIQSYVFNNRSESPQSVVKLAESIEDEGDRQRAVGMAAVQWMREDEAAAKAYIQQSTALSDEAKRRIQEGRGFGRGMQAGRRRGN
jgi:hypothetical protein